jgi:hypothetical protein
MRRDFVTTRVVLAVAVVASLWWLSESPQEAPRSPARGVAAPAAPEPDLTRPEIQALWQERRRQLADLGRRLAAEPDSACADSLRAEMEHLITRTERDVRRFASAPEP